MLLGKKLRIFNSKSLSNSSHSFIQTPLIKIFAGSGDSHMEFEVHQGLLCPRSKFFTNALKPDRFKERQEKVVMLEEEDAPTVALYIQLLYRPDLMKIDCAILKKDSIFDAEYTEFCRLYVLAERLMDDATKTSALGWLIYLGDVSFYYHSGLRSAYPRLKRFASYIMEQRRRIPFAPWWSSSSRKMAVPPMLLGSSRKHQNHSRANFCSS